MTVDYSAALKLMRMPMRPNYSAMPLGYLRQLARTLGAEVREDVKAFIEGTKELPDTTVVEVSDNAVGIWKEEE